jgi:pyridoxal phosphate enzyme (YggS family)
VSGVTVPDVATVRARVEVVRDRIAAAGGDPDRVRIVAVTKAFPAFAVEVARSAGLTDVGENYTQELVAKQDELGGRGDCAWHFLGRLQRNKVRHLVGRVDLWQSVDRPELVDELARRAPGAALLVQVNVADEPAKGGCATGETASLVARARDAGLDVRGLMAVGPAGDRPGTARAFAALARLADGLDLPERSMGMTDDLEDAVAAGATMVRMGRALFGVRPSSETAGGSVPVVGGAPDSIGGGDGT